MPLKFKNIPKRPHKTIWYHLMNFFVPHILSAEIRTFEEPCAKDLLIAEKNDILWNSSTTLICVHYTISTPFATKLRGSCGKNLLFRRNFRSIFPCIIPWLPRKKSGFFKKKLHKTLTLWPIFGPKIGLLVRFLDHMMQNFKYNRRLTLVILWTSLKVRYKPTGLAPNSQPHPSLFFLTSAGHSTELFDSSIN